MDDCIKNAIHYLINAKNPRDVNNTITALYQLGQNICVEISLEEYSKTAFSEELSSLINMPDSDLLPYFLNENLYFLDNETLEEMFKRNGKDYTFEIDFSVMFDTNYASYVSKFINNPDSLDKQVRTNLEILIQNDFRFDYMFYIAENYYNVFHKEGLDPITLQQNKTNLYYNLMNLELFKSINVDKYIKDGVITFNIDKSEALLQTDLLYNNLLNSYESKYAMKEFYNIHKMMVLYIIGMLYVNHSSNKAPFRKMEQMFKYMSEVIGLYFEREIKFTYDYFENPAKFKIFNKIQKNIKKDKLKKIIENIAWDLSMPRIAERLIQNVSMTRYFIPFFLTHDSNLKMVFDAYKVKGILFNKEKTFHVAFSNINIMEHLIEKKCQIDFEYLFSAEMSSVRKKTFEMNKNNGFLVIDNELSKLSDLLTCG